MQRVFYTLNVTTNLPLKNVCLPMTIQNTYQSPIFISVTNTLITLRKLSKHKVLGRPADDIYKIINSDSQTSEDILPRKSGINTVVTEKSSSAQMTVSQKTKESRDSISIRDKYASYLFKFARMLEPFASLWDGNLRRISTVKHIACIASSKICPIHSVPYRAGSKTVSSRSQKLIIRWR